MTALVDTTAINAFIQEKERSIRQARREAVEQAMAGSKERHAKFLERQAAEHAAASTAELESINKAIERKRKVARLMKHSQLARGFRHWRDSHERRCRLFRAAGRMHNPDLSIAFCRWRNAWLMILQWLQRSEQAAIRLQAVERGRTVRKTAAALEADKRAVAMACRSEAAAVRVQAAERGRTGRKTAAALEADKRAVVIASRSEAAVVRVQAAERGRTGRKTAAASAALETSDMTELTSAVTAAAEQAVEADAAVTNGNDEVAAEEGSLDRAPTVPPTADVPRRGQSAQPVLPMLTEVEASATLPAISVCANQTTVGVTKELEAASLLECESRVADAQKGRRMPQLAANQDSLDCSRAGQTRAETHNTSSAMALSTTTRKIGLPQTAATVGSQGAVSKEQRPMPSIKAARKERRALPPSIEKAEEQTAMDSVKVAGKEQRATHNIKAGAKEKERKVKRSTKVAATEQTPPASVGALETGPKLEDGMRAAAARSSACTRHAASQSAQQGTALKQAARDNSQRDALVSEAFKAEARNGAAAKDTRLSGLDAEVAGATKLPHVKPDTAPEMNVMMAVAAADGGGAECVPAPMEMTTGRANERALSSVSPQEASEPLSAANARRRKREALLQQESVAAAVRRAELRRMHVQDYARLAAVQAERERARLVEAANEARRGGSIRRRLIAVREARESCTGSQSQRQPIADDGLPLLAYRALSGHYPAPYIPSYCRPRTSDAWCNLDSAEALTLLPRPTSTSSLRILRPLASSGGERKLAQSFPTLPPANARGFGAPAYEAQPMFGSPSRSAAPYW